MDLVFVYPEEGETKGYRRIANHDFFARLGRKLIGSLNDITSDGYVFRVDMRLRPYGESGPLAMSFAMLEEYFITQGANGNGMHGSRVALSLVLRWRRRPLWNR